MVSIFEIGSDRFPIGSRPVPGTAPVHRFRRFPPPVGGNHPNREPITEHDQADRFPVPEHERLIKLEACSGPLTSIVAGRWSPTVMPRCETGSRSWVVPSRGVPEGVPRSEVIHG